MKSTNPTIPRTQAVSQLVGRRLLVLIAGSTLPVGVVLSVLAGLGVVPDLLSPGISAIAVGLLSLFLIRKRLYRADWISQAGAAMILLNQLFGNSALTPTMAAVLLIAMGTGLVVLMPAGSQWPLIGYGMAIVLMPALDPDTGAIAGAVLGGAFALLIWLQYIVLNALRSAEAGRQQSLEVLNRLPVALFHEDFSGVMYEIALMRGRGIRDIEAELRANPTELRRLVQAIRVIDVNQAAVDRFGVSRVDMRGRLKPQIVNAQNEDSFLAQISAVAEGRHEVKAEYSVFGENERHFRVEWLSTDPEYRTVMVALHDVSDLRVESNLQRALAEGKDRFIATVSHELRTPLTAVLGFATELHRASDEIDRETIGEYAGLIVSQARDISYMVEDLLVAERSTIDRVVLRPIDLQVLRAVGSVSESLDLSPTVGCPADLRIHADEVRVRQILRNLFTNAERYGGDDVRVEARSVGGQVVIDVSDDGDGVPVKGDLFEPYSTGWEDRPTGSTGLGLYVSRSLARAMGGDLGYVRERRRTIFRLSLPEAGDTDEKTGEPIADTDLPEVRA